MTKPILIGYFIRRTVIDMDVVRGKTFCAYGHRLYPTREWAAQALAELIEHGAIDTRFEHDVAEAWMGGVP